MAITAGEVVGQLVAMRNEAQRQQLMRFFKTAPGQYGYGDDFLGVKVPQTRQVARQAKDTALAEIPTLLLSRWHEVRLCGLLLLVDRFERNARHSLLHAPDAIECRDQVVKTYIDYASCVNNWDLVDLSVPKIVGHWLMLPTRLGGVEVAMHTEYKLHLLDTWAKSDNLWLQRMSMVCTWKTTQMGDPSYCLRYAERHLRHPHDLMHKAVGWMLREMGKRVSQDLLREFLRQHVTQMPRTTLRYAIEKLSPDERQYWMTYPKMTESL